MVMERRNAFAHALTAAAVTFCGDNYVCALACCARARLGVASIGIFFAGDILRVHLEDIYTIYRRPSGYDGIRSARYS